MSDTTIDGYSTEAYFVEELASFCQNNIDDFQDELSVASSFAYALCGLFALFFVANIVWKSWVGGGQIDLYKCLKPFVIGFLIINFTWVTACIDFVAGGFDLCAQSFVGYEQQKSQQQNENVYEAIKTMDASKIHPVENVEAKPTDEVGSNDGNGQKVADSSEGQDDSSWSMLSIKNWLEDHFSWDAIFLSWQAMCRELWCEIATFLASMAACAIILLSFANRCILTFFGPFIFAMSLLPASDGLIMGWVRKYLTYSLYPVILNIINGVMTGAMCMVVTGIGSSAESGKLLTGDTASLMYINLALVGVSICSIFMYLSVPSIANQLMDVTGNMMGTMVGGAASYFGAKAGTAVSNSKNKVVQGLMKAGTGVLGTAGKGVLTGGGSLAYDAIKMGGKALWGAGKRMMGGTGSAASGGRREAGTSYSGKNDKGKQV